MNGTMPAPPMSPSPHPTYAGFWKRFAAYLIDKFIISAVVLIVFVPMVLILGVHAVTREDFDPSPRFIAAAIGAYFTLIIMVMAWPGGMCHVSPLLPRKDTIV